MSALTIEQLIGDTAGPLGLGENMTGPDLTDGYIPDRSFELFVPTQIGDGLAGPVNEQNLEIYRDNRVIATDELGMQGPFQLEIGKYARHRAGRNFPLNFDWIDDSQIPLPGLVPEQDTLQPSPLQYPDEYPLDYQGFAPVEVLPNPTTVYYTASPAVGWEGY